MLTVDFKRGTSMTRVSLFAVVASLVVVCTACSSSPPNPLSPSLSMASSMTMAANAGRPSYDATGLWHGTFFLDGQQIGEGVHIFTQDQAGNLTAVGSESPDDPEFDPSTYTFMRINGTAAPMGQYRLTLVSPDPGDGGCGRDLSGKARLDSRTNTIEATTTGVIDNCATVTVSVIWQKQ